MFDYSRLRTDILALVVLVAATFLSISLISQNPRDAAGDRMFPARQEVANWAGTPGALTADWLTTSFGVTAWFVVVVLVVWDVRLFTRRVQARPLAAAFGVTFLLISVCTFAQWLLPASWSVSLTGPGGRAGAWGWLLLNRHFDRTGSALLLASIAAAGLLLCGEWRLVGHLFRVAMMPLTMWGDLALPRRRVEGASSLPGTELTAASKRLVPAATSTDSSLAVVPLAPLKIVAAPTKRATRTPKTSEGVIPFPGAGKGEPAEQAVALKYAALDGAGSIAQRSIKVNPPVSANPRVPLNAPKIEMPVAEFRLPATDLLEDAEEFPYEELARKAQGAAQILERTFQEFGLNVKVSEIDTGPVITQFELELDAGLRLSKVSALADDLAIALRVPSVRVVSPIPGKNTVGVEVPNGLRVMVRLKELIDSSAGDLESKRIPIFLGKDVSGRPLVVDLCKMPHLLIAGRTGTGKSVCLNTLILSMLMTRSPDQVKLLMIDPKMVELSPYMRIPHLMHPVITDMKKAEAVLAWAVDKMEERYDLLARVGVRHLDNYNKLGKDAVLDRLDIDPDSDDADEIPDQMPYIVIIADEMADMMMTSGKDVEAHIIRLAQKSRAVGIHLVLATQKPTVDVITGLIKSNLPARIAFQVSSRSDSRVVLDEGGADKLLGNGDLLYLAPGTSHLTRAQGTYVSDEEVNTIIDFYSDREPQYSAEITQVTSAAGRASKGATESRERDDLYDQAVEVIIREGRGSVSLLQRALGVGYGRGARLIDYMSEDGIVGTYNGSQAREVLMTLEQWTETKAARGQYAEV